MSISRGVVHPLYGLVLFFFYFLFSALGLWFCECARFGWKGYTILRMIYNNENNMNVVNKKCEAETACFIFVFRNNALIFV